MMFNEPLSIEYTETHKRTIAKTLTVRVCFTLSHILNGWIVTGELMTGVTIASVAILVNMFLFWIHERIWNWFQWNRNPIDTDTLMFVDGHPRTLSKSITWRALITVNNFMIPFLTTGSWQIALAFLTVATFLNIIVYYAHERAWNLVKWGKIANDGDA
jgi:uncharacterized membrane protein